MAPVGEREVTLVGTTGSLEDTVNDRIVSRIARRVALLRAQAGPISFSVRDDSGTFDGRAGAVAQLPELRVFESSHLETLEAGPHDLRAIYHLTGELQGWNWAERRDSVDWPAFIAERRRLGKPPGS